MAYRDSGRDHGSKFGGRSNFNRGPRGPVELHDAVCCDCGVETKVPFEPDPKKQVRCKECHVKWKEQRAA